ncbi:alpha/beta hydrolase [Sphingomicrobium sediminis]|uniref:Alpha/beta hydrolase n=1 Tax=Sphingomicrobium sediminis TaxID=2950949 RepID=A0A9X2EFF7_9SPHN|nr:alpha/beta hydrolase [Sphingomicrobium sediminis]MCM8556431.1 alpha/beta hydrolase [Sphingomicrobium sediminis]
MPRLLRLSLIAVLVVLGLASAGVGALYAVQRDLIYPGVGRGSHIWDAPPAGFDVIETRTADDLRLRAFYRAPADGADTIIYFHGNGGTALMAAPILAGIAGSDRGLLLVEYRGYAGNPGSPTEDGLYADGRAALDFLSGEGVDNDDLIIGGFSLGTGVASKMADEVGPKALFLLSPFTSLDKVAAEQFYLPPLRRLVHDKFPTDERIADIPVPLFIAHGSADELVPDDHGRSLAATRPDAETLWLQGAGHGIPWDGRLQVGLSEWIEGL